MSKRTCRTGINLLNRYLGSQRYERGFAGAAEMARVRMYQVREKRTEDAWKNHKSRCRICSGVKSE